MRLLLVRMLVLLLHGGRLLLLLVLLLDGLLLNGLLHYLARARLTSARRNKTRVLVDEKNRVLVSSPPTPRRGRTTNTRTGGCVCSEAGGRQLSAISIHPRGFHNNSDNDLRLLISSFFNGRTRSKAPQKSPCMKQQAKPLRRLVALVGVLHMGRRRGGGVQNAAETHSNSY